MLWTQKLGSDTFREDLDGQVGAGQALRKDKLNSEVSLSVR